MTFLWEPMLWLLLLVPLLAATYVALLRRRKRTAVRYANLALVKQAMAGRSSWRRHVPPALFLLAITILILAVARPAAVVTLASSRSTVILAMDVSGSMRAKDVLPTRLEASQAAAKKFISQQPSEVQIGIVAFAAAALLVQAPTVDREALYTAIDQFQLWRGTAVGSGLLVSLATIFPDQRFEVGGIGGTGPGLTNGDTLGLPFLDQAVAPPPKHEPVEPGSYENAFVILLTDGATTTGPDPILAGKRAAEYGVKVYTVGFGSTTGDVVDFGGRQMRAQLDETTLQEIAKITDGEYFAAQSSDDLSKVYDTLSSRLVMEKKLTEIAFIFAGIGALIALIAAGLSLLWFNRLV